MNAAILIIAAILAVGLTILVLLKARAVYLEEEKWRAAYDYSAFCGPFLKENAALRAKLEALEAPTSESEERYARRVLLVEQRAEVARRVLHGRLDGELRRLLEDERVGP